MFVAFSIVILLQVAPQLGLTINNLFHKIKGPILNIRIKQNKLCILSRVKDRLRVLDLVTYWNGSDLDRYSTCFLQKVTISVVFLNGTDVVHLYILVWPSSDV